MADRVPAETDRQEATMHLCGTSFLMKVWETLLPISHGVLASFGDVAIAIAARDCTMT